MTESKSARRNRLRRMMATTRGRVEVVVLSLVVLVCGAVAFTVVPAIATDEKLAGEPVPDGDVPALVAAALSCPALNPPRLAAQIMATSGYSDAGTNGNIAGMDPKTWSKWRPTSTAKASDHDAAITAVGHRTCEVVGLLRSNGLKDRDLWPAAMAAEKVGIDAVIKEKGIPSAAEKHVDKVSAYARWYADQPAFNVAAKKYTNMRALATGTEVPVPADLVPLVQKAGTICPAITPARIAAQLRAASNFNANLRSDNGAQGIAQFSSAMWEKYAMRKKSSVWEPKDAIPALGVAMCDLNRELSALNGNDSYVLALGAFQWGPKVIRQAAGLPRTTVPQLADSVLKCLGQYEKDERLKASTGKATSKPQPSSSTPVPSSSSAAPATPGKTPEKTTTSTAPTKQNGTTGLYKSGGSYKLYNGWSDSVLDIPGNETAPADGTKTALWKFLPNAGDMWWRLDKVDDKYLTITNEFNQAALTVASMDNDAKVVVAKKKSGAKDQQWMLRDVGNGQVAIINRASGKAIDLLGDDYGAPFSDGTWNGFEVSQWDFQDYAKDQRWTLQAR